MRLSRRTTLGFLAAAAVAPAGGARAAKGYPTQTIRMTVGFPPGGPSDVLARIVSERLGVRLGQAVIVDNKPGAGGNIAASYVAKAAADGYTLLLGNNSILATNPALYRSPGFDVGDFAPVTLIGTQFNVLVVNPALPVRAIGDVIALAKAEPHELNFGSSGIGTAAHLAGELFKQQAGLDIVHIPYSGASPALTDLISGRIQLMFATSVSAMPFIRTGAVRPIAVTTAKRAVLLPDLPTVAEGGLPGFEATTWHGLVAPAALPGAIIGELAEAVHAALADPEAVARLNALGVDIEVDTPEQFSAYISAETLKWAMVVKEAHVQIR